MRCVRCSYVTGFFFFFQAEDGIRDLTVTGVQTCALPILGASADLPAVRGDAVLRQLTQPTRLETCTRHRPSRGRLVGAGRALAVLLSGRRLCGILNWSRTGSL